MCIMRIITGNYSTSKYDGCLFSMKAPCKIWWCINVTMRQPREHEFLLRDLSADPAHINTYPGTGNLHSQGSQLPPTIFPNIKMKLGSRLYFHSQVLILSPTPSRTFPFLLLDEPLKTSSSEL